MNLSSVKALFKKEISDIFRDKKTLFMMVVIPLILYPLLIVGMTLLMNSIMTNQVETVYRVAFDNVPHTEDITALLSDEEQDFKYEISVVEVDDASKALSEGDIDAYVSFQPKDDEAYAGEEEFVTSEDGVISLNGNLQITYYEANDNSATAEAALEELLNAYQNVVRSENIAKLKLDEEALLYPVSYTVVGLSSVEETMGSIVGSAVPMMVIVSILLGAIYPAIDVTAGEKERGTLETLLTLPVTNLEMIMSKFLAVAVIACISALLNICSMGAACGFMMSMLTEESNSVSINFSSFIPALLITIVVMIAFALFVTAVCMCVCVFAKSFKEANNYVTPVMLIFMFGGFASMVPNLKLTATTAAIPVINVALLINDLFQFKYDYALLGIVFLSNVIYSLITVMVLGKIYNSEAILFSEGLSSVKFVTKRSEMKKGQIPGIGDMVLLSCVTMLLMLYVGTAAQLKLGFGGVAVTQAIILAAPILYGWYIKTDFVKLFSLRKPKLRELLGSFFLWVGVYSIEIIVSVILSNFMKESATNVQSTFDTMLEQPILLLVLVIALMPAVGEELLFRGFLFGTLRDKVKPMTAMLIVSAIFGIYHMSLIKFITTAILGFLLVWVVYQTGSIFCSILIHFCNNLLSVFIMKYPTEMAKVAPIIVKEKLQLSDYFILTAIGIAGIFVGEMFLHWKKKTLANNQNL